MFAKRKGRLLLAKAIEQLAAGPGITMLRFDNASNCTITNCNFDGKSIAEALQNAVDSNATYRDVLSTIRTLAGRLSKV